MTSATNHAAGPEVVPAFANHLPVRIAFGAGALAGLPDVLGDLNARRVFVALDAGLDDAIPQVAAVLAALDGAGLDVRRFDKPPGEPTVALVDDCAAALAAARPHAIVAIGGGSAMDTAKAARLATQLGLPFRDAAASPKPYPEPETPLVLAPTTAGTGSEVSGGAVISDPEAGTKAGIAGPQLRAQHALVDPELTMSLPPAVTAHTGIDALAQAIAAIVATTRTPIGDGIALESIRLASRSLAAAVADGSNAAARSEMACASLLGGLCMNISDCSAEHSLGQALGGRYGLPHGLTIGLVLAETLERERQHVPDLLERVADAMGVPDDGSFDGSRAVRGVRNLLAALDFPVMADCGVKAEDLDALTDAALADYFITTAPEPWTAAEVRGAFEAALALRSR